MKRGYIPLPKRDKRPTVDAYYGMEAEDYGKSQWMARNQSRTTAQALQYILGEQLGEPLKMDPAEHLVLDIGCGTGYSSHEIADQGFRPIGVDRSRDMLHQFVDPQDFALIEADMRSLPLRPKLFDMIISISAFNFATAGAELIKIKLILFMMPSPN